MWCKLKHPVARGLYFVLFFFFSLPEMGILNIISSKLLMPPPHQDMHQLAFLLATSISNIYSCIYFLLSQKKKKYIFCSFYFRINITQLIMDICMMCYMRVLIHLWVFYVTLDNVLRGSLTNFYSIDITSTNIFQIYFVLYFKPRK